MSARNAAIVERNALTSAIALLERREVLTTSARERNLIRLELPLLRERRNLLVQRINANRLTNIAPPSEERLREAREAARELDGIAAANTTARGILNVLSAARDLVET